MLETRYTLAHTQVTYLEIDTLKVRGQAGLRLAEFLNQGNYRRFSLYIYTFV